MLVIEAKDILNWYFNVAALFFGVFGFLYSTYAAASFQVTPERPIRPPITTTLRLFCRILVLVIALLTAVAIGASYKAGIPCSRWIDCSVWIMIGCFVVLTGIAAFLAYWKME
jgi:hypothetical protein